MERPTQSFFTQAALVTLGCLSGAIYCGFLLYQDVQNLGHRTGTSIARLERMESKVRLKAAQSFVWGPAHAAQDLYVKDSLQTPESGGAAVKFNDGSVLEVGENSLIVIDKLSDLSLGFIKGTAILRTVSGDSRISLDASGKTKIERLPVRLVKPDAYSEIFAEKGSKNVDFSWALSLKDGVALPQTVTLEISSDRKFKSKNLKSLSVDAKISQSTVNLPPGKYFWRVTGKDLQAEAGQFRIDSVQSLKPIYPASGQVVVAFGEISPVEFNWSPEKEDSVLEKFSHKIEISPSEKFDHIISSEPIVASSGSAHTKGLPAGLFFWRIVSSYKDSNQAFELQSAAERFQVDRVEKAEVALDSPADLAEVEMKQDTKFAWSTEASGTTFEWQIKEKNSQTLKAHIQTKTSSSLLLAAVKPKLPHGQYLWSVKAFSNNHLVGESAWREVVLIDGLKPVLKTPLAGKEYRFWNEAPQFNLVWSPDSQVQSGEDKYLFEIASSDDMKNAAQFQTSDPQISSQKVISKPGDVFWRVSVIDSKNQVLKSSLVSHFFYGPFAPLRAPASVSPQAGTIFNPLAQEKPFVVTWSKVDEAQGYELILKSGDKIVVKVKTDQPAYEFKNIKPGKYTFSVSALDPLKRNGEQTPVQDFEVTYGEVLDAPESLSPEVQ